MALTITTWSSGWTTCETGWQSWGATGANIVSVGVQTSGNQQNFAIVQCFVGGDGTSCYVQVANNGFADSIDWQFYLTMVYDDDEAAPTITAKDVVTVKGERPS